MASGCTQLYLNTQIPGELLLTPLKSFTQYMGEKTQNTEGCENVAWIVSHIVLGIFAYPIFGLLAGVGTVIKFVATYCFHVEKFEHGNSSSNPVVVSPGSPSLTKTTFEQIKSDQQNKKREVLANAIQVPNPVVVSPGSPSLSKMISEQIESDQQNEKREVPANDIQTVPKIQQKMLDVAEMIERLSEKEKDSLVKRLTDVLSNRIGNSLDNSLSHSSGAMICSSDGQIQGVVLTSLKKSFLSTSLFTDDIVNDFQNKYSKIARGESFTYTLEELRRTHERKKNICTSTPRLDPLVQDALRVIVNADKGYVLGFELDMAETQKQRQLVFSIFENDGAEEISRTQVTESEL